MGRLEVEDLAERQGYGEVYLCVSNWAKTFLSCVLDLDVKGRARRVGFGGGWDTVWCDRGCCGR